MMATSNRASSGLGVFSKGEEEDSLSPFPEFLGLGDEQNDGEEHLNVRPWSSFGGSELQGTETVFFGEEEFEIQILARVRVVGEREEAWWRGKKEEDGR